MQNTYAQPTHHRTTKEPITQATVLKYINEYRKEQNLPPLKLNRIVSDIANKHSREMANKTIAFGHGGFANRIQQIKYRIEGSDSFAENVAYGYLDAKEVVEIWVDSRGHRKNIEGKFNETGIGIAKDSIGKYYFTQIFLRKNMT